jgi:hypothetical protein
MRKVLFLSLILMFSLSVGAGFAADVVPPVIDLPGTQPGEGPNFESPDKCDNCHGGYDSAIYSNEPAFGWRGSAMGNAGRDPIFWATLAIAEQDFDGAGDLCIRCHSTGGWVAGRSTPTDGSGLQASDDDGVDCDACHKATNPDNTEWLGVMNEPFVANNDIEGFYGSGMLSSYSGSAKLGPYDNAEARHQFLKSRFHRGTITDPDPNVGDITSGDNMCGTCHDVSNSAVGHFAPNFGAQPTAENEVITDGPRIHPNPDHLLGTQQRYVALNNPPYAYGIVERTYSEWKSGALDTMNVMNFPNLPADLQATSGALNMAYQSAMLAGGTYEDGTKRTFNCMGCHMRADIGEGCNKTVPTRADLPKHDLTGGNYWVWPLIKYQDQQGTLRLGGGLTETQLAAIDAGQIRGEDQLRMAANLTVSGNSVTITNLTGHKLITGYPEGRRMWLNVKWYDVNDVLVGEDGAYGPLCKDVNNSVVSCDPNNPEVTPVTVTNPSTGQPVQVESIIDLHNTKIYEVHPAMTQDWANVLINVVGYPGNMPLSFDRVTGQPDYTLGQLAALPNPRDYHETFHFVLNNYIASDNRIPPYGMDYEAARVRNALPVPTSQYGSGTASYDGMTGVYQYWETVTIVPPAPTAVRADITLYYQGTSWEYVQFLNNAVSTTPTGAGAPNPVTPFLADEGRNFLDAWINTGMVPPFPMATATWPSCEPAMEICSDGQDNDCDGLVDCNDVADCGIDPACCTPEPEICNDGQDNDCDAIIDCNDADCGEDPVCQADCSQHLDKGACNNDPNCEWQGSPKSGTCVEIVPCVPTAPDEVGACGDGIDNDCDGITDCGDSLDCGNDPVCQVDCSVYTTRNLCNAQATCKWDGKNKVCANL